MIAAFWLGLLGAVVVAVVVRGRRPELPLVAIADAPDAQVVRIRGKVSGEGELQAPLSGRRCTYFTVFVVASTERKRWHVVDARPFAVADATGRATIPAATFEVPPDMDRKCRFSQLPARLQSALGRLGIAIADTTEVSIQEGIIGEGDEVDVIGAGMRAVTPEDRVERGFRDRPTGVLELSGAIHVMGERRAVRTLE